MRRIVMTGVLTSCLAAFSGCNKSDTPVAEAPATAPAPAPVVPPQQVVTEFLEAVRTGNDKTAESMLTQLARVKTKEMELMVAPPGSPTAQFEVGAVEVAEQNQLAYVESRWTDVGAGGKPEVNEFVWALRMDGGQWRIGGVATQPYPNMGFLQLDFENPEEMIKQTQLAEQEYQRLQKQGTAAANGNVAAGPQTPGTQVPGTLPPNAISPDAAAAINAAAAAATQSPTNTGVQTSFSQNGAATGLGANTNVQSAGGLPASPAQNNSQAGAQAVGGVNPPGTPGSGNVPFSAQQPTPGNVVPR